MNIKIYLYARSNFPKLVAAQIVLLTDIERFMWKGCKYENLFIVSYLRSYVNDELINMWGTVLDKLKIIRWNHEVNGVEFNLKIFRIASECKNAEIFKYIYNESSEKDQWIRDEYIINNAIEFGNLEIIEFIIANGDPEQLDYCFRNVSVRSLASFKRYKMISWLALNGYLNVDKIYYLNNLIRYEVSFEIMNALYLIDCLNVENLILNGCDEYDEIVFWMIEKKIKFNIDGVALNAVKIGSFNTIKWLREQKYDFTKNNYELVKVAFNNKQYLLYECLSDLTKYRINFVQFR